MAFDTKVMSASNNLVYKPKLPIASEAHGLGRCVLAAWLALMLLVGVVGYALRNSVDQSAGLLLVAGLYCTLLAVAPTVDRFARR